MMRSALCVFCVSLPLPSASFDHVCHDGEEENDEDGDNDDDGILPNNRKMSVKLILY